MRFYAKVLKKFLVKCKVYLEQAPLPLNYQTNNNKTNKKCVTKYMCSEILISLLKVYEIMRHNQFIFLNRTNTVRH